MKRTVLLLWLLLTCIGPMWNIISGKIDWDANYRTANRESAHIAPDPQQTKEAIIQVYAARAFNWRGVIATHSWIAVKPKDAQAYTVYQVVGWRTYRGLPALVVAEDIPDRYWYNAKPELILDMRGSKAETLIPRIQAVAEHYPYANYYGLWPGPNSNTFPAYVARQVPELGLALPTTAIGKDFLVENFVFAQAPSATGYQCSFFGLFGLLAAKKEGIEVNILGLVYGIRFSPFRIILPGLE